MNASFTRMVAAGVLFALVIAASTSAFGMVL